MDKRQNIIAIVAALLALFSAMWDPRISVAVGLVALVVLITLNRSKKSSDDFAGNPLNPEAIAKRRENLEKIMQLAGKQARISNDDVQKTLGVSDATATRYLQHLENLGKLVQMGERGQQVYYQIPPR